MPHPRKSGVSDLNLIPLMNLFVTMIPLLLLTAAFYHIGMVSASVPTHSEEESDIPAGPVAVSMNVRMTPEGFSLSASSATLGEEELKELEGFVPKKGKKYDYAKLRTVMEQVKRRYEKSDTMILIPAKENIFDEIIETMDTVRKMEVKQKEKKVEIDLFPVVVVTSLVE
ncbi:MAG: biopolymer transporter ExbD [Pseudomonadota bacterium]